MPLRPAQFKTHSQAFGGSSAPTSRKLKKSRVLPPEILLVSSSYTYALSDCASVLEHNVNT